MQTTRYEMILICDQPISHGKENLGNDQIAATKMVRLRGGEFVQVPDISADTLRNRLRAAATYATLDVAGLKDDPNLDDGAMRLLLNGGMVTGKGSATVINIDRYRQLVDMFPFLSLFGGCLDNRPMESTVKVDDVNMICSEMTRHLPPWIIEWAKSNNEAIGPAQLEEVTRYGHARTITETKLRLLSPNARANVSARLLAGEKAHATGEHVDHQDKTGPIPYSFERIPQGTLMWTGMEAITYTDIEFDAFNFAIAALLSNLYLAGKSARGHGRMKFLAGSRIHFQPGTVQADAVGSDLAPRTGELYKSHIMSRKEEIREWLTSPVNS